MRETKEKKVPGTQLAPYKPTPLALRGPTTGSIEDYIRAANAVPVLTPEKERELAIKLRDEGDMEAASQLVTSHLRLVISIARQYMGYGLPFPDMIQEGNIGLMKAVKRFDPDRGVRLVTFAMTWIRAEIQEYVIKNWKLVKVATTKAQRKLFFNLRSMKEGEESLTPEQTEKIAQELEVRPKDVKEMEMRLLGHDVALDEPGGQDDEQYTPEDWLASEGNTPEENFERANYDKTLDKDLPKAIEKLDPRSRRIIEARWLYDDSSENKGATLEDLSQELGISKERVRQIEKKALQELKKLLEKDKDYV